MSIPYNYEIIAVDQAARCMEVVYTSPGRQTMHIGARLPYVGEEVEDIVKMYSPVAYWKEQEANVVVPELGGGTITPPEPPPPVVIASVTMRQARLALHRAGLLDQVDAAITDAEARIEWEYATTVERNSPLVQNLAAGLGLTEQQLDDLFTQAAGL
jgi:hypothetical protein